MLSILEWSGLYVSDIYQGNKKDCTGKRLVVVVGCRNVKRKYFLQGLIILEKKVAKRGNFVEFCKLN